MFQVMIDFQAAERHNLQESASEISLEALCAMVCILCFHVIQIKSSTHCFNFMTDQ